MKVELTTLIYVSALIVSVSATYPLVLFSHKLVPKVQAYINNYNHLVLPLERVNEITRNTINPCTSDSYVFVDQPGLTLDDLQDLESYTFLRTYSLMSSTLGVLPRIDKPIDFDKLTNYTVKKCRATFINVDGFDEAETYIDDKTRVIKINLPPLPDEPKARKIALMKADETIRVNLRKLPSPDHTVIYSTSSKRLLNKQHERRWEKLDIFPDIANEPSRIQEYERNNNVKDVERPFPEKRMNLIDYSQWKVPELLDAEIIYENELLILGIIGITGTLILYQLILLIVGLTKKLVRLIKPKTKETKETKPGKTTKPSQTQKPKEE